MLRTLSLILVASLLWTGISSAREIRYDAEQALLIEQHGDAWRAQDAGIDAKLAALREKTGKPPNIIHIMWDDQSVGEVGIPELNKVLGYDTPNLNQMADEGIAFTRLYTEPSCTPTRTAALTGRLAVRAGMTKVGFPVDGQGLHEDEVTIAEVLSREGYRTVFVGKGHQGDIEQSHLHRQGFDYANFSMYNQFPFMTWHPPAGMGGLVTGLFPYQFDRDYTLDRDFRPLGYLNQLEARKGDDEAREYLGPPTIPNYKTLLRAHHQLVLETLRAAKDAPEPLYLAYWPHLADPFVGPDQITTSAGTWYAESVVQLDRDIGEILALLRELDMADNTLVIAMADNGPMHELTPLGPHEIVFSGYKSDFREGGIRVPAFAWWPGTIEANQVVGDIVTVHDLFTTFARLGGAMKRIPRDRVIDGVDQTALLLEGDGHSRRDYYHVYTGDVLAASIKQQFKRVWVGDRPGLVGDAFHDLYKDPREVEPQMMPFLWAWASFDKMRERHLALMERYENRPPTTGEPFEGIADLRPETKLLRDKLRQRRKP